MLRLILSPTWFLAPDISIDFFSFCVLVAFAIISIKYYNFSKNKNFLWLGISFLLISIGELCMIVMNLGLYYDFTVVQKAGGMIITSHIVKSIDWIYYVGFFLHRFLVMLGFYFIYYTTKRNKSGIEHLLIGYFIIIAAIFTDNANHLFNITVTLLVAIIFFNYIQIYKKTKHGNTKILSFAFLLVLISYLIMIFATINGTIYVVANLIQLAAFIIFLYLIIRIYKYGNKKK